MSTSIIKESEFIKNVKNGLLEHELNCWWDFCKFVKDENKSWPTFIYRGQANAEWKVESTLDRLEKKFPTKPNLSSRVPNEFNVPRVSRDIQIKRFKELAWGKFGCEEVQSIEDEKDQWWAIGQHCGLATPVLDWTYSPFVALFFAFEEEKCDCDGDWKEPEKRAIFALTHHLLNNTRAANGSEEKLKIFVPRGGTNYKASSQSGIALRMPQGKDLEAYLAEKFDKDTYKEPSEDGSGNFHPKIILQKFIIPNEDRIGCLRFLDYMNINRASLFPDLDNAARYVNQLWEVNFDKAVGYIGAE